MGTVSDNKRPSGEVTKAWDWRSQVLLKDWNRLSLVEGVLYRRESGQRGSLTLVIPYSMRLVMLSRLHDDMGHPAGSGSDGGTYKKERVLARVFDLRDPWRNLGDRCYLAREMQGRYRACVSHD